MGNRICDWLIKNWYRVSPAGFKKKIIGTKGLQLKRLLFRDPVIFRALSIVGTPVSG